MDMKVDGLIKILKDANPNYTVKIVVKHGYPDLVIIDFNDRIYKIISL